MSFKKQNAAEGAENAIELSDGDKKLIIAIFKHSPKPMPNWEKVKEELGSASAAACQKRLQIMCKKHGITFGDASAFTAASPKKRSAAGDGKDVAVPPKKRKRALTSAISKQI